MEQWSSVVPQGMIPSSPAFYLIHVSFKVGEERKKVPRVLGFSNLVINPQLLSLFLSGNGGGGGFEMFLFRRQIPLDCVSVINFTL